MTTDISLAERPAPESLPQSAVSLAPLIELRHVSKSYVSADGGSPVTVLDDISLEVRDGEMLALLGQSGSGKSTILRLMAGLTEPTQGAVLGQGVPLDGVNRGLSIVFQSFALYPGSRCRRTCRLVSSSAASMRRKQKKRSRERWG